LIRQFCQLTAVPLQILANAARQSGPKDRLKVFILSVIALIFWLIIFGIVVVTLRYFLSIEGFGEILVAKLLAMTLLTFFSVLLFSNIITSLSTFYLSDDLRLLVPMPIECLTIFSKKLGESIVHSSWMVLVFGVPLFAAYGYVMHVRWHFIVSVVLNMLPFITIPAAIGAIVSTTLVNIFPARRTRDILALFALVAGVLLIIAFRFLKPEQLVDAEQLQTMTHFMAYMKVPTSVVLPNYWLEQIVLSALMLREGPTLFYHGLLWSSAFATYFMAAWATRIGFFSGVSKAQESRRAILGDRRMSVNRLIDRGTCFLPGLARTLLQKDIKIYLRDATQWSQFFLTAAIMSIYLYSIKVLPLEKAPIPTDRLANFIAFVNVAISALIISAIGARFVFTTVSLEGRAFWLIRTAPLSMRQFLWTKLWLILIPFLVLSEGLVALTNHFLLAAPEIRWVTTIAIGLLTFAVTSLGVGMGAIFPSFKAENVAKIATGFGGIVYMIVSAGVIVAVTSMLSHPSYLLYRFLRHEIVFGMEKWLYVSGMGFAAIVLTVGIGWWIMRLGISRLQRLEGR